MSTAKKLMGTTDLGGALAIEDVFSTYLYEGQSTTLAVNNGIDLAAEDGMTWIKCRNAAEDHFLFSSLQNGSGQTLFLRSNLTNAATAINNVSQTSTGFSLAGGDGQTNQTGNTYASWTFRKAPRFFDVVTWTGDGTNGRQITHNLANGVGCCLIKKTNASADWWVYHSGATDIFCTLSSNAFRTDPAFNGVYVYEVFGDGTSFQAPTDTFIEVSSAASNENGAEYVAYLFAHDPLGPSGDGSDGLIACDSFNSGSSSGYVDIDLGWEPQWVLIKRSSSSGDWYMFDTMRGVATGGNDKILRPNADGDESLFGSSDFLEVTPTGFRITPTLWDYAIGADAEVIYIAIRRGPMRQPESGSEVFAINTLGSTPPAFVSNFPLDMAIRKRTTASDTSVDTRILGENTLFANLTSSEGVTGFGQFDYNDGYFDYSSTAVPTYYSWMFRRAPGFFDVVAYTGTGSTQAVSHNLTVAPEMIWTKQRNGTESWGVFNTFTDTTYKVLTLNYTNASTTAINYGSNYLASAPTDSQFELYGDGAGHNTSGGTYIAYLFASLAGISKVGSYTGNGSSQTIDCGFTSGARFVLIKRTDSTGDWYVWDTERGIVAANDPHLSLNTTAAEVTTDDSVDPDSSGFIVNQNTATNINVSSASYIFYAVS